MTDTLVNDIQTPGASDPHCECVGQEKGKEEAPALEGRPPHSLSSLCSTPTDEKEGVAITNIRATDIALGLRRVPAGFYAMVHHSGLEWRTENKRSLVNDDIVEWSGQIALPSDLSTIVLLEVYASFEFQPMLGTEERLRQLTITVEQLLNCSAADVPFTFFTNDGDVVSPCSSIFVTVGRPKCEESPSARRLGPHCSITEPRGELEDATNQGRHALSRYQKYGGKRDLERSITAFEQALNLCPLNHPCRGATQSNLGTAKFILCRVEGRDNSFEDSLELYRNSLAARPVGHVDRPSTLIQLAVVHFARFEKRRDEVEAVQAEALLHEAMELCSTESHENRAATFLLQLRGGRGVEPVDAGESPVELRSTSRLTDEASWIICGQLLDRFERFGDSADMEQAITHLEKVVGFLKCSGELRDLEDAISMVRNANDLTPPGHPHKPAILNNLADCFVLRFERLGQLSDLEDTISMLRDAVNLIPHGHPEKLSCLHNLGISFFTRFECLEQFNDLEDAISTYREAVNLTPHGHPCKSACLSSLGYSLVTRFERLGELPDLEGAISVLEDAVDVTPHGHPEKPSRLNDLGNSFSIRFERLGELSDLEKTITTFRGAVDLTPHGHPEKPSRLNNLGVSFRTRFDRLGEMGDLENAISILRNVVDVTPHDRPEKSGYLNNLGISFLTRFECLGEVSDLQEAVSTLRSASDLTPHGHPEMPGHLYNLGGSLLTRFERFGELSDLEDAISTLRDAVNFTPRGHPRKPAILNSIGISLVARFERLGELSDLKDAISVFRSAVGFTPHGHPEKADHLSNLGNTFLTHFERVGELSDLEDAISTLRDAINLTPHSHPERPAILNNLGNTFRTRFEHLGELSDLEDAVSKFKDAVDLTPHGHSQMPGRLYNLGSSFLTRFERLGQLSELEDAISTLRDSVNSTPHGHPGNFSCLGNLGSSFRARFERLGELSDLEDAISTFRGAVDLTPHGHLHKPAILNNLGNSFSARFERLGELGDLEAAISTYRDAVDLIPYGHPHKPAHLNNLGSSFLTRFERLRQLSDLEDAISTLRDVVYLTPHNHPEKPIRLNNLGNSFITRFECLGELSDLEDALSMYRDAVDLSPHDHPHKPAILSNLGNAFVTRFERLGEQCDLEAAISTLMDAVDLTPHGHPEKPRHLSNLANSFFTRFKSLGELYDLDDAISSYSFAASAPTGPISVRFYASQKWISCAQRTCHHSLLHAYSVAINHLPQLAWVGLSLTHRYSELKRGADIVREAAAAALDLGFPQTAVEWLEQGRSIVWGELFQLRSSYDELSSAHPDHARRLQELSSALDNAGAIREKSLSTISEHVQSATYRVSLQDEANRHRKLAIERDKLLQEIRRFPNFEQFLRQKNYSQLRAPTRSGPVVILNAAKSRCDALVVLADVDHVIHVPLPSFNFQRAVDLQNTLGKLLGNARDTPFDDRKGRPSTRGDINWESLLSALWNGVTKPVLDALAFSILGELPRIFWCPTGPFVFLPIHAAGLYDTQHSLPGHKVSDFAISSYVPTLSILALSHIPNTSPRCDLRLLAVRQPASDGLLQLQGVHAELERIKDVIRNSPSVCTTLLESSTGTVDEVLDLMKEADWVHFACHGIQDATRPTESGLCLANGHRLKITDMLALARPRGGLAFLSACQTAMGDEDLSDEAIHIAAGMLFAGYGGVIGTMWSISDRHAPSVARDVYEHLYRNGTRPDYRDAARALHEAIVRLRDSGQASFVTWLPFIHVGL